MSAAVAGIARMVGHDVDTDQIYHGQYLFLSNSAEMVKHVQWSIFPVWSVRLLKKVVFCHT
ncbi:hypothetical protein KAX22_08010 [bacterium]|nr:hypothetical protein [bacterium]